MKDWRTFIQENLDSDIWGFICLDYYSSEKGAFQDGPSSFLDNILNDVKELRGSIVNFHKVLLSVSVQLLGSDFADMIDRSVRLIRKVSPEVSGTEIEQIAKQFSVYGKQRMFLDRLEASRGEKVPVDLGATTIRVIREDLGRATIGDADKRESSEAKTSDLKMKRLCVFYSYSHLDEKYRKQLEKHLSALRELELIEDWYDGVLLAGDTFEQRITEKLQEADLILLLISHNYISSKFCTSIEMKEAIKRHESKTARVVPILLSPCDWRIMPFGKIVGLPKDMKAVSKWQNRNEAYENIAVGIRRIVEAIGGAEKTS